MPVSVFSRYYRLKSIDVDGRIGVAQRLTGAPAEYPDSILHRLVGNETLDQLAKRYYGREDLWWRIADANPAKFPLDWQPGETVVIPPIRIATRMPRR